MTTKKVSWVTPKRSKMEQARIKLLAQELQRQQKANKNPALMLPDPFAWMDERDAAR